MALATIAAALAQYNANLNWHQSQAGAESALEAIRFLLANRGQRRMDQQSSIDFESLEKTALKIETFIGANAPRAFGRSRRVGVAWPRRESVG